MRKWWVLVVVAAILTLSSPAPARAASILFIGNSFTFGALSAVKYYRPESVHDLNNEHLGGVPALFKAFTEQAHLDYEVSLETSPGKNFDFHLQQKAAEIDRPWDHVLLQGYSTLDQNKPGDPALLIDYAGRLARLFQAKNARVDIRLVSTWSRADQTYPRAGHWHGKSIDVMANDLREAYDQAATTSPAIHSVIPVGQAWNRAIAAHFAAANPYVAVPKAQIDLWAPDHYHGSNYGYYLEALVIFGNVTGRDPRTLGPHEQAAAALGIDPSLASNLQQIAAETLAAEK
ncbi:MAG: PEP-CTERM sorting domain-containing protein [Proteobacteria bacterium]|nr:PEP-CTERM sorting domain-containing protein [Pseudomonadota bacterium]